MTRARRCLVVSAFVCVFSSSFAEAAPWWLEGLGQYRIVDASGRIDYRPDPTATGRIAYRPASAPSPLLRARPYFIGGYAGAAYGPRGRRAALAPTGYYAGEGRKPCGHVGPCQHTR